MNRLVLPILQRINCRPPPASHPSPSLPLPLIILHLLSLHSLRIFQQVLLLTLAIALALSITRHQITHLQETQFLRIHHTLHTRHTCHTCHTLQTIFPLHPLQTILHTHHQPCLTRTCRVASPSTTLNLLPLLPLLRSISTAIIPPPRQSNRHSLVVTPVPRLSVFGLSTTSCSRRSTSAPIAMLTLLAMPWPSSPRRIHPSSSHRPSHLHRIAMVRLLGQSDVSTSARNPSFAKRSDRAIGSVAPHDLPLSRVRLYAGLTRLLHPLHRQQLVLRNRSRRSRLPNR